MVTVESPNNATSVPGDVSTLFNDVEANWHTVTARGRKSRTPFRYREPAATVVDSNFFSALSDDEDDDEEYKDLHRCDIKDAYVQVPYPDRCPEVAMVGAGQRHQELQDTDRLKVMTYKEAMTTNLIEE